jgi:S1-C subfamily serine protease
VKKTSITLSLIVLMSLFIGACSAAPEALLSQGAADIISQAAEIVEAREAEHSEDDLDSEPGHAPEIEEPAPPVQAPVDPGVVAAYENVLTGVYEYVNPSVVNIRVKVDGAMQQFDFGQMPDLPFDFGIPGMPETPNNPGDPEDQVPQDPQFGYGMGSGFVWDKEGHIVTNNHVVDGAVEIEVTFSDGTSVPAELVGADPYSDLAVIKVDIAADALTPIQVADSDQVKVGELAIAIGNPFGLDGTMTVGIVSALGRTLPASQGFGLGPTFSIPDVIQTDAPINPGNSGGVLVDDRGTLIGVPTAIESPVGANAGIGFAVPSNNVTRVVPILIEEGAYQHAYLGISGTALIPEMAEAMDLDSMQRGALVTEVVPGGPAEEAGLRGSDRQVEIDGQPISIGGDVIIAIDGGRVREMDDLIAYLTGKTSVGQKVTLTVLRDGKEADIDVTLGARPNNPGEPIEQMPRQTQGKARLGIIGGTLSAETAASMDLSPDQTGVLVEQVQPGGPAESAGLAHGDVITALNGEVVESIDGLISMLGEYEPGETVRLTILRDGDQLKLKVTLGEAS